MIQSLSSLLLHSVVSLEDFCPASHELGTILVGPRNLLLIVHLNWFIHFIKLARI